MTKKKQPNLSSDNEAQKNNGEKPKFNAYWIYIVLALVFIGIQLTHKRQGAVEITSARFEREMLRTRTVEKIVIVNQERAEIYIKKDSLHLPKFNDIAELVKVPSYNGPHYAFNIGTIEVFIQRIDRIYESFTEDEKAVVVYETRKDVFGNVIGWLMPIIIIVVIWIVILRLLSHRAGGGPGNIFSVGKSKAILFDKSSKSKINFNHVAGLEEAKIEVMEIVDFLKNPKKYTELGGKIPKGALLVGPPGTGKTLLAKAVAGEAHVPFFSLSGSDFVEMFVGVGASRVRDLFAQAKAKAPCIVFIDEIDAIGRARGKNPSMGANDERENTLNQLLSEMDGFADNSGVIIMAATNRVDILDRALMRAGRFDRQIHVELPDMNERKAIFKVHLAPLKIEPSLDVDFLSQQTPGFSGADIANVCNEAALIAARKNKQVVEKQDFLDAIDRIVAGLERKNKIISKEEKLVIAYHEAGHATLSWFLKYANPLVKVTIIPRGRSLGAAWYLPEERQINTGEQLLDEICVTLGGRASEEITFKQISTGALNDLERVTKQAYAMISYFGMSKKLGNISYYDSSGQYEFYFNKPYSEKTAEAIDAEVKKLIDDAYERAKMILKEHKEGLKKLAEKLLEKEVIYKEDLLEIFGPRPFPDKEENIQEKNNGGDDVSETVIKAKKEKENKEQAEGTTETKEPEQKNPSLF